MPLDLSQVIGQIEAMAGDYMSRQGDMQTRVDLAVNTAKSTAEDFGKLKRKIETSKTTWLVAGLKEEIGTHRLSKTIPDDLIVLASDGSHMDVDRHHALHCFLINIGIVQLQYGKDPDAVLCSSPSLYFKDEEVAIYSTDGRQPIEGQLLGIKRGVEELSFLVRKTSELKGDLPIVALVDGSLILWGLVGQTYPDFVVNELLAEGFLKQLDELKKLSRDRQLAIASYISFPRSADVINALRIAICPYNPVDCDRYCPGKYHDRKCDLLSDVLDRTLFSQLLTAGERSALFASRSTIVEKYGPHEVNFFYLKLDDEIARVEIPQWVAEKDQLVDLVHSVILDQSRRGQGYPVALSEAHEKAVVTGADREVFWELVEQTLGHDKISLERSAKQRSKKTRWA